MTGIDNGPGAARRPADAAPATKLVATIGPATWDDPGSLLAAGVSVIRLNLAHGSPEDHSARVASIRAAARERGREVCLLADLPGPKVRLGALAGGEAALVTGTRFALLAGAAGAPLVGDAERAATTHPGLAGDLRPGDRVHLSDGAVELVVEGIEGGTVTTVVERGGTVRSGAGVNVPAERLSLPAVSERDRALAALAVETGIDLVGQSFVRARADVDALRAVLGPTGPGIVAKIETRPAVEAFEDIAEAADAIMIARGDLGLELPFEAVPGVQKRLVALAVAMGRPVIVATQMLESMITAPRPTRAEASDVANAVADGADAVMLSGETAIGAFPQLAASAAVRICRAAEEGLADQPRLAVRVRRGDALAVAAVAFADADPEVSALAVAGGDPRAVLAVAARRPRVPVLAIVADVQPARRLALVRGVLPVVPADTALAADPGDAPADMLLRDPAVVAALRTSGRVVIVRASGTGAVDRMEVVEMSAATGA